MFNLEEEIAEWRCQMLVAGIKTPVPLDELESHLREEIEQQMKSGLSEQDSFALSVQRIGQPAILKSEFNKNEGAFMKKIGAFAMLIGAVIILRILTEHPDAEHLRKNEQVGWLIAGSAIFLFGLRNLFFNSKLGEARDLRRWKLVGISYSMIAVWISTLPIFLFLTVPRYGAAVGAIGRILTFTALGVSFLSVFGWRMGCGILPIVRNERTRTRIGIVCCLLGSAAAGPFWIFIGAQLHFSVGVILVTWAWTAMAILGGVGYGLAESARTQTGAAVGSTS